MRKKTSIARLLFWAFWVLFPVVTISAQTHKIDSLEHEFEKASSPAAKVDLLNALCFEHFNYRPEDALRYAEQAYSLATQINYDKGIATALTYQGIYQNIVGNLAEAKSFYRKSLTLSERVGLQELSAYTNILLGNTNRYLSDFDSARSYYQKGLSLLEGTHATLYLSIGYKNMGHLYRRLSKPDSALYCYQKCLELRQQLNDPVMIADALNAIGNIYLDRQDFDTARDYFEKTELTNQKLKDPGLEINYLRNMGALLFQEGKYADALDYDLKALDKVTEVGILESQAEILISIGLIFENQAYYERALEYYLRSLQLIEQKGYISQRAEAYNRVAWIYKTQGNYKLSEEYVNKSIGLYTQMGDEPGLANCYNILGLNYYLMKNYATSLDYHRKALDIRQQYNNKRGIAASLFNMALVYEDQNRLDDAYRYQKDALVLEEQTNNRFGMGISCNGLGRLLIKMGRFSEAENYLSRANTIAHAVGSRETLRDNYKFYSRLYERMNNNALALSYLNRSMNLSDSLYNEQSIRRIAELQSLFELEGKEKEIQLLNQQNELNASQIALQRTQIRQQNFIIIAAMIGFLLISAVAYVSYTYNRKLRKLNREINEQKEEIMAQSEELIEANQTIGSINRSLEVKVEERTSKLSEAYKELDTFFYRSSHDFRRPLTTFLGLAEVARITVKDQHALELFARVRETAQTLDKMLVKLQSISDLGAQQLVYKEVFLQEILEGVRETFHDELNMLHVDLNFTFRITKSFNSYPAMVKIIAENLVENAIQFRGVERPVINVRAENDDKDMILTFEDNGQGISQEYHERIFDMYFRANQNAKGNGLGLYIVKKAIDKLNGKIEFKSAYAQGSVFVVRLPLEQGYTA